MAPDLDNKRSAETLPSKMSARQLFFKSLLLKGPAAVLVGVALFQMALATFGTLSAWKGGGFGMFAALDGDNTRSLHYFVTRNDGEEFFLLSRAAGNLEY